ncbi:prepilin-type N-terminal cleavage/methylation domain-containing protein [Desulfuromonas acetoxidans]|uniref:type IV pilin protein n=1 Tax=Desulfuromonas acetoxidans TaxID=891 RepID=UPI002930A876|nr:prepilin-type N-terminal cleavage/methylation domain-containing protein [Desulfuromonas acetoxidans]
MIFSNKKGYTLIEMLIVVTIIGILSSIAIPHYLSYRDKARMVTVYTTLRQIRLVEELYWTKHESYFPDPLIMESGKIYRLGDSDDVVTIPRGQTYTLTPTHDIETGALGYIVIVETNLDRDQNRSGDIYRFSHEVLPNGATNETPFPLAPIVI